MLQFSNSTPFKGTLTMFPDAAGIDTVFTIVKATFVIRSTPVGATLQLAEEQIPIAVVPEYTGEPGISSLKVPCDVSLEKPGTDIVIMGQAWAFNGKPVQVMDVGVRIGPIQKIARVFGDRFWSYTGVGYQPTPPTPFEVMPLIWERAYGGSDVLRDSRTLDARNPVGTGFRVSEGGLPVEGVRLPNVESPTDLITSWNQRPEPVGFAPIDAWWEPRRSHAGTYDERWQSERAPYLPDDFDPRFLQIAPADMIVPRIEPGTWVDLRGFSRGGVLQFQLPDVRPRVVYHVDGTSVERPATVDTVIIEPDRERVQLVWRAALRCDKKMLKVARVDALLPEQA